MTPPKKSNTNIESKLHELEGILEELESGELDLDDALKKFEKGIKPQESVKRPLRKLS